MNYWFTSDLISVIISLKEPFFLWVSMKNGHLDLHVRLNSTYLFCVWLNSVVDSTILTAYFSAAKASYKLRQLGFP